MRPRGNSTKRSARARPRNASIAAAPVSPEVATTIVARHAGEIVSRNGVADKRADHVDRNFGVGATGKARDLTGVELRPGCGDVETPVAGKPRERRLDKAERRGLAPGRDVAHGKLRSRLCRPSRRTSLARRSDHITYWIRLCFLADCEPPRNTGIKDSGKALVP